MVLMHRSKLILMALVAIAVCWASPILGDEAATGAKYDKVRDGRRLIKSVRNSVRAGQFDSAMVGVDSVLAGDSSNADAWYFRGLAQAKTGDTAMAMESLGQGSSRAPLSTRIKLFLARLNLIGGDAAAAETTLDQILAIKPNQAEALYLKGLAQLQRSDTTAALELFERSLNKVYESEGK